MENDNKKLITEKIDSGEYFKEGLSWYNSRFIKPQTEFIQMSICAVVAVFIFLTGAYAFSELFPLSRGAAIILPSNLTADQDMRVSRMMDERDSPTQAYVKFMLMEFTKAHEEYRVENLDKNQQFVIQNAVESISSEYIILNDRSNPDSPIVKYGKSAVLAVYVDPDSIVLVTPIIDDMKFGQKDCSVKLQFSSTLYFNDSNRTTSYEADIKFKYKELIIDQVTHEIKQLPQIIITDYKTKAI